MVQMDVYDGAQWVTDVRDPSVSTDGLTYTDISEAWVYDAGEWKKFYVREVGSSISVSASGGTYTGDSVTVSGAVLDDQGQLVPGEGTVLVEFGYNDGSWTAVPGGAVPLQANGQYQAQVVQSSPGAISYRATFQPAAGTFYVTSQQVSSPRSLALRMPTVSYGSVTDTSYAATCTAVTGASTYEWQENSSTFENDSSRSISRTGKPNYTTYTLRVRSQAVTPNGTVSSGWVTRQVRTGRPELRDIGSKSDIAKAVVATGQYRADYGWGWKGDKVGQGYYSGVGSGGRYWGTLDYGSNGVKNAIIASVGSARYNGGSATAGRVFLYKVSGTGCSTGQPVRWYRTNSAVNSGGAPGLIGTLYSPTGPAANNGAWVNIGSAHADGLANGNRSLCMYINASGCEYQFFNGKSSGVNDCDLRIDWSWNYVTQTDVPGKWL